MIKEISYNDICKLWKLLWPEKQLRPFSQMKFLGGKETKEECELPRKIFYFGYYNKKTLVGVNSCHSQYLHMVKCVFRSRGLYVLPEYRKKGIGTKLLKHSSEVSFKFTNFIWSFPKQSSIEVYKSAGFIECSPFASNYTKTQDDINCYVSIKNK